MFIGLLHGFGGVWHGFAPAAADEFMDAVAGRSRISESDKRCGAWHNGHRFNICCYHDYILKKIDV
jgi:hypothetical protein